MLLKLFELYVVLCKLAQRGYGRLWHIKVKMTENSDVYTISDLIKNQAIQNQWFVRLEA